MPQAATQQQPQEITLSLGGGGGTAPVPPQPAADTSGYVSVEDLIRREAEAAGIPVELALAVAEQESGFNPNAKNAEFGATGVFQIIPSTGKMLNVDINDPYQNIKGGVTYLRQLLDQHQGDLDAVLNTYGGVKTAKGAYYAPEVRARIVKFQRQGSGGGVRAGAGAGASPTPAPDATTITTGAGPGSLPAPTGGGGAAASVPSPVPPPAPVLNLTGATRITAGQPKWRDDLDAARRTAKGIASAYDPRTAEGLINIGGTVGGLAVTAGTYGVGAPAAVGSAMAVRQALQAGAKPWIVRTLAPILGAGVGGTTAAAGTKALGMPDAPESPWWAGAQQAGYEGLGSGVGFTVRRLASGVLGSKVARLAKDALTTTYEGQKISGRAAVDRVRDLGRAMVDEATEAASSLVDRAKAAGDRLRQWAAEATGGLTSEAQHVARQSLARAEADTAERVATAQSAYDALQAASLVDPAAVPAAATSVLAGRAGIAPTAAGKGPAIRALEAAGQAVDAAAQTGPPVDFRPVIAQANALAPIVRPPALYGSDATKAAIAQQASGQGLPAVPTSFTEAAAMGQSFSPAEWERLFQQIDDGAAAGGVPDLPGLLGLIQRAPETMPYAQAHRVKQVVQQAADFEGVAQTQAERTTKALAGTIRQQLVGHAPYDEATAAYAAMATIYNDGIGEAVVKAIRNGTPDKVARLVSPEDPLAAQRLKTLLVDYSAQGGDREAGIAAWRAVQDAFTLEHFVRGGPAKLAERVKTFQRDNLPFAQVMFGDPQAMAHLSHLVDIGDAYTQAVASGPIANAAAKARADMGVQEAADVVKAVAEHIDAIATASVNEAAALGKAVTRTVRRQAADQRLQVTRANTDTMASITAEMKALKQSSLPVGKGGVWEEAAPTAILAGATGGSKLYWIIKTIQALSGGTNADLLQWSAYSDARTRALVQVLSSRWWDRGTAMAGREAIKAAGTSSLGAPGLSPTPSPQADPTAPPAIAAVPPPGPPR